MGAIQQIDKLEKIFSRDTILKIEKAVEEWKSLDFIEFNVRSTVVSGVAKTISIKVSQPYVDSGLYLHEYELREKAENILKPHLTPGTLLYVDVKPHKPVIVDIVTPKWIEERMLRKGIRPQDIVTDTGIDRTNISVWISGRRPMSQPVKALFYFYLTRPTFKSNIISAFLEDLSLANIGTTINIMTEYLSEMDIRHHVTKKAFELNCLVTLGDFTKEIAEVNFIEKRYITA